MNNNTGMGFIPFPNYNQAQMPLYNNFEQEIKRLENRMYQLEREVTRLNNHVIKLENKINNSDNNYSSSYQSQGYNMM